MPDLTYLSDEWLVWALEHGAPGERNSASYFQLLPTIELRKQADGAAQEKMLATRTRYSDAVWSAVQALLTQVP